MSRNGNRQDYGSFPANMDGRDGSAHIRNNEPPPSSYTPERYHNSKRPHVSLFWVLLVPVFLLGALMGWSFDHPDAVLNHIASEWKKWETEKANHADLKRQFDNLNAEMSRKRQVLAWQGFAPGPCLEWGVRKYTAVLTNVGAGLDPLAECINKTVPIHGSERRPTQCFDPEICGRVNAQWNIDFNEAGCQPYWKEFLKRDCKGGRRRAYHAQLENVEEANWLQICETTHATINGVKYMKPDSCTDSWGWGNKWGIWFIDDEDCP